MRQRRGQCGWRGVPLYLVQATGNFTSNSAGLPAGDSPPTGTALTAAVDPCGQLHARLGITPTALTPSDWATHSAVTDTDKRFPLPECCGDEQNADMDPSEVLGVRAGASPAEVRRAFARELHAVHPDVGGAALHAASLIEELVSARDELLSPTDPTASRSVPIAYRRRRLSSLWRRRHHGGRELQ